MTDRGFAQGWVVLQGAMPQTEIPNVTREMYRQALGELSDQQFIGAVKAIVTSPDFQNWRVPTIAEIKNSIPTQYKTFQSAAADFKEAYTKSRRQRDSQWESEEERLCYMEITHKHPFDGRESVLAYLEMVSVLARRRYEEVRK